jgi:FtsH-binding integral membrane protein
MKYSNSTARAAESVGFDEGLRSFMVSIFNNMALGLVFTGIIAWAFSKEPLIHLIYNIDPAYGKPIGMTPLGWISIFAPIFFVFMFGYSMSKMSLNATRLLFFAFAGLMGISLSNIFLYYTEQSIVGTFFITAATFGGMALYGNTTKKDLTSWGSFLMMGLFGVIIASLVNMFMQSSGLNFAVSLLSVFIFMGLTAYDIQSFKRMYMGVHGYSSDELLNKLSIQASMQLYMDFINLFVSLLRFFGDRKQ